MAEYDSAFERAVNRWLDSHETLMGTLFEMSVKEATDNGVEKIADAMSKALGKFLDDNKDELVTSIAAAIAASWKARHP